MNIKNLFQKSTPKKMNATVRRAAIPVPQDYDSDEPNVRLSKAFFVVMLLHIVAVGGIFAFSTLKKNAPANVETTIIETPSTSAKPMEMPADTRLYTVTASDTLGSIASTFGLTRNDLETANHLKEGASLKAGDKLMIPAKSAAQPVPLNVQKLLQLSQSPKVEKAQPISNAKVSPAPVATTPVDSKIYVVQKGDNPVLIAKKQGIKYADLLSANNITDPKKLQIGQKLIIPQK